MAALDRSVLDAQVCSEKEDECGTPELRVVRAPNLPGAVVARRVRDSTVCVPQCTGSFFCSLEHCACESALSTRPLAVACGTCMFKHRRSLAATASHVGWQSLAERVCVWGPVVSPLAAQLSGRPCLLSGAQASQHGPIVSRWDMLQRSVR